MGGEDMVKARNFDLSGMLNTDYPENMAKSLSSLMYTAWCLGARECYSLQSPTYMEESVSHDPSRGASR